METGRRDGRIEMRPLSASKSRIIADSINWSIEKELKTTEKELAML